MTRLLVSVRSVAEAVAALAGADVIDVKEPAHGPLGRASAQTIVEVVRAVGAQRPVSAALGEWPGTQDGVPLSSGISYLKWGFSRWDNRRLAEVAAQFERLRGERPRCGLVAAAYADWERAGAPTPDELCHFACAGRWGPFLIDTWMKDGSTLLDWLSLTALEELGKRCRRAGVPLALAGSLGFAEVRKLLPLRPDWIAVRGAVCPERDRTAGVSATLVQRLAEWIRTDPSERVLS